MDLSVQVGPGQTISKWMEWPTDGPTLQGVGGLENIVSRPASAGALIGDLQRCNALFVVIDHGSRVVHVLGKGPGETTGVLVSIHPVDAGKEIVKTILELRGIHKWCPDLPWLVRGTFGKEENMSVNPPDIHLGVDPAAVFGSTSLEDMICNHVPDWSPLGRAPNPLFQAPGLPCLLALQYSVNLALGFAKLASGVEEDTRRKAEHTTTEMIKRMWRSEATVEERPPANEEGGVVACYPSELGFTVFRDTESGMDLSVKAPPAQALAPRCGRCGKQVQPPGRALQRTCLVHATHDNI